MGAELKSDDGKPLELKEGVLLDRDGTPLLDPNDASSQSRAKIVTLRGGWLFSLFLGVLIPALFVVGFTFITAILALFLVLWVFFGLIRAIKRL